MDKEKDKNFLNTKNNNKFDRIDPSYYFKKIQSLCYKKCSSPDFHEKIISAAEKNCLDRCVFKFQEAEEFGFEAFQYYKLRIKMDKDQK